MNVEFYIKGEHDLFESCDQSDIPRQGDGIVIEEQAYKVSAFLFGITISALLL